MRSLKWALALAFALVSPVYAATEASIPLSYQSLTFTQGSATTVAKGLGLPVLWFSGAGKRVNLESGLGYANLQAPGAQGHYGTAETDLVFHFDLGPLTPRLGVHNSLWAPIRPLSGLDTWMVGLAPTVGLGLDLGALLLEAHVSHGPIWSVEQQWPYRADLTRVEGRVTFAF
ncbi:MAG: hypothetical protein ACM3YO_04270 [Bacteroidota bacterium]